MHEFWIDYVPVALFKVFALDKSIKNLRGFVVIVTSKHKSNTGYKMVSLFSYFLLWSFLRYILIPISTVKAGGLGRCFKGLKL